MKKFYESPVVELTGFSAEDVITTSAIKTYNTTTDGIGNAGDFAAAVAAQYEGIAAEGVKVGNIADNGSYNW